MAYRLRVQNASVAVEREPRHAGTRADGSSRRSRARTPRGLLAGVWRRTVSGGQAAPLSCHACRAARDAPQSSGVVHAGQSASSSVTSDPQCEHCSLGAGSAA
jgi:hypothetical protein